LTKDLERRRAFANYFAYVSNRELTRKRWKSYAEFVDDEIKVEKERKWVIEKAIAKERGHAEELQAKLRATEKKDKVLISKLEEELSKVRKAEQKAQEELLVVQSNLRSPKPLLGSLWPPSMTHSFEPGADLTGLTVSSGEIFEGTFPGVILRNSRVTEYRFTNINFKGSVFLNATFRNVIFRNVDLENSNFRGALFEGKISFEESSLKNVDLREAVLQRE
jgi:hypothetical protein